ncbi:DUF3500 domain-containing protein (plasmid) [Paenibacillus cellulosilyticus]|nr:DUF3500 domain-containing protein [Paenibacillus cellulosilyticus]
MNVTYDSANKTVNIAGSSSSSTGAASTDGKDGSPPDGMPPEGSPGGTPPSGTNGAAANRVTDVAANIVNDPAESDESVVALTKAFMATLSDDELESLQYDMTADNAAVWSNLPVGAAQRNGLMLGSLDEDSLDAFKSLAAAALGNSGYDTLKSIILADEYLTTDTGNNMWDSDLYYVAVLGEPSDTSPWILQIGGHHYATNLTYNTATESPTPMFVGVEPQTFTSNGVTYSPLESRRSAMYSMINSLSDTELSSAKISKTYDDVLLGPGQDNKFPTTSEGILVSSLDSSQKELVKAAITAWVQDTSPDISEELLASYLSDDALNQTKIGWSGSTDSTVHGSYIRIDGPRVWIEFVCQTGVAYTDQIHFHTVWRDKTADYGGSFGG